MTYWFYAEAMRTREHDIQEADKVRLVRVLLDRMAAEIRQATIRTKDAGEGIDGDKEEIEISSYRLPSRELADKQFNRTETASSEYDLVETTYRIARHPDILDPTGEYEFPLGLARVETLTPRALPPGLPQPADPSLVQRDETGKISLDQGLLDSMFGTRGDKTGAGTSLETEVNWQELYSQEIRYLRFCYYDGKSWWDDWHVSGDNPLPQLVLITIGLEPHPPCGSELGQDEDNVKFCECLNRDPPDCKPLPPDQFSTIVRLTSADPLFRSRVSREGQNLVAQTLKGDDGSGKSPGAQP